MEILKSEYKLKNYRSPESYRDQIQSLVGLPTLPTIATEVINLTRKDNLSANQMVPIIDQDPTLGMKLLKIVNSAFYGLEEKIDSLRQAIVIIGLDELSNLAVGLSVIKSFQGNRGSDSIQWKHFWEHSSATGNIAEILCGELKIRDIEGSPYSMGLLHDIGKIVLYRIEPKNFLASLNIAKSRECSSIAAETEVFGLDHMQAGMWIAEKWQLPNILISSIGYHHDPRLVRDKTQLIPAAIIELADLIAILNNMGFGYKYVPNKIEGWDKLNKIYRKTGNDDLEELVNKLNEQVDHIKTMVQIDSL